MLRRLLLLTVAALVALIIVIAGAAYWFFGRDGFRLALESQATSWLGHPVRIGAARAQFFPRLAVSLKDIRVGEPAQLTLAKVDLASDLRPLLSGRIENADVTIADSRIDLPLPFSLPDSSDSSEQKASSEPAVRVVSIRSIALRDVRLRSRGREVVVSADSAYGGTALALKSFTAESGGTKLSADGIIAITPRIDARVNATANRLDLDELIALADAFAPAAGGGSSQKKGQSPRIGAGITAKEVTAGRVKIQDFVGTLARDGDSIALNPVQFQAFGGRYAGSIVGRLGKQLSATLDARIEGVDVAQLAAFGGSPDSITGTLSATGKFGGSGADVTELLRIVRGNGAAAIVNGSIQRLHLVRTVILFFGRPAPDGGESTDRFDRLDARFSIANRIVNAEAFSLSSPDADTTGAGTLSLDSDALDGRVNVKLSEALTKQAGTDLIRYTQEGNRVVLPATIGGTLSAPRLTIDVGAAAKRGLQNEVQRRLKGLFDGLGR